MKKLLFLFILMLTPALANAVDNQQESLYGEWRLVGWYDGGIWFEVDTNYVSHHHMSIEIKDKEEGYTMAYSMVNEIFVGLLTLNGNEMIFDGEYRGVSTKVLGTLNENLFFEDHICDIKFYQLEGKQLKLYYTDNDYFVFTKDFDDSQNLPYAWYNGVPDPYVAEVMSVTDEEVTVNTLHSPSYASSYVRHPTPTSQVVCHFAASDLATLSFEVGDKIAFKIVKHKRIEGKREFLLKVEPCKGSEYMTNKAGMMHKDNRMGWMIVDVDRGALSGVSYLYPMKTLPETYQKEGLSVIFSGDLYPTWLPPTVVIGGSDFYYVSIDAIEPDSQVESVPIDEAHFPDSAFRARLIGHFDWAADSVLTKTEAKWVRSLDFSDRDIKNLKGIEYFTNLIDLRFSGKNLEEVDLSKNTELVFLKIENTKLSSIDLSNNLKLNYFSLKYNLLNAIDLSKNTELGEFYLNGNQLTSLDLTGLKKLAYIDISCNHIKGKEMDKLIASLSSESPKLFYVINTSDSKEENVVTKSQVAALQAKGWKVYQWNNGRSSTYLGSDPTDEYHPLIEEGKVWTYHYQGFNGREFNVGRVIDGDTIIGGLTYKKIYDKIGGQYQYALREEGKKIYIVHPHYETASLLYDFGKNAGDVIDELEHPLIVASVDTIDIDGVKFRRMRVQDAGQPVEKWSNDLINMYNFWIEGVGSESLLETSIREPGNAYNLLSCQINGRVYTQQELLGIVSNSTPQDDYRPFVVVGKKWDMIRSDFDGDYHHINYRLTNEKVEKAGKTYLKMYRREGYSAVADDERLLREENRKVYIFDPDLQKEFLLFDYSLKAGDTYETYSYDEQKMVSYKVVSVRNFTEGPESIRYDYDEERDSMITQRRYLRKWTVCRTDDNSIQKTWIESVGSLEGPLANLYARPISFKDDLAYVEDNYYYYYLPFSFHNEFSHVHGCNLPTGAEDYKEDDERHKLTYELEGNRLHVYGKAFTQCGPNNYAYFYEKKTDDPLVNKIQFVIQEAEPMADCMALHATNFYVPGFDPNMNYIVIDNQGEEHPVINKTPQMDYRPLVEEGKVWKVGTIPTALDSPVQVVDYYYFDGDTIIGEKTCKQMMCQRYVSPNYSNEYWTPRPSLTKVGAWYEEDKKVYSFDERQQTMTLKYDFSLEANDTLHFLNEDGFPPFIIGPKQIGGLEGFKGVYREIMIGKDMHNTIWLEGVGVRDAPFRNAYDPRADLVPEFLISCTVGDEVIYLNDRYEDGATPESMGARKNRFDFTHTIKTKPKAPIRRGEELPLYGEYNDLQLGINLDPLDDAYLVNITDVSGKVVYEKAVNAGNIVGLNIDISAYEKGHYTVNVENSRESFTGQFDAQTTGIKAITNNKKEIRTDIYNLQGQRLSSLQKGLNIVNGQKIYVK